MICFGEDLSAFLDHTDPSISADSHRVLPPLFDGGFEKRDATAKIVLADVVKEIRRERSSR